MVLGRTLLQVIAVLFAINDEIQALGASPETPPS